MTNYSSELHEIHEMKCKAGQVHGCVDICGLLGILSTSCNALLVRYKRVKASESDVSKGQHLSYIKREAIKDSVVRIETLKMQGILFKILKHFHQIPFSANPPEGSSP